MTFGYVMKKSILPMAFLLIWVWLVPRNFDIGGTVGVWFVNILVGCIIGGFVVVGYVIRAVYVLASYLFGKVTKTGCIPE